MKVRVANTNIDEVLHHYVSAGFSPVKAADDTIELTNGKAVREELEKALKAGESYVTRNAGAQLAVLSGGKGRPFYIPR